MAAAQPYWERCRHDDCIGVRLPAAAWCLAHAAEQAPDAFDAELERISAEGSVDARGVVISAELLARLLAVTPRMDARPTFTAARFEQATFQSVAYFGRANFQGDARFTWASFQGEAYFREASFQDRARFEQASFQGEAYFREASFQDWARFEQASFQGEAYFDRATFLGEASFGRASFQGVAGFDGASFQGVAGFDGATFQRARLFGPLLAKQLILDGAVFSERVQVESTAAALCARRAQFPAGVHLRLRYAMVDLDDAYLVAPAILAGAPAPFPTLWEQEEQFARGWERLPPGPRAQRWRPRLLSIRRVDLTGLRLTHIDLRACRFNGAANLDRMRIEGVALFARTTGWWRARRKTLAEEQHWRANRPGRWRAAGWYPPVCQPPASPNAERPAGAVVEPAQLAGLYRELRKGREDAKDEPGAADFYYGECEMRRHDPGAPRAERLVLWLYWLVSGYALRASRAMLAWALLVVAGALILAGFGLKPPVSPQIVPVDVSRGQALYERQDVARPSSLKQLPEALAFSAESTVSLLRAPDRALTLPGRWAQMVLRILGPVLFSLAVLSLRGRVRR